MMAISIRRGDCRNVLRTMPDCSVHCCVTSPPYFGLRDYGHAGQIGLESTPDVFVAKMVAVFREVRRVLRDDGTLWLNLGDSYSTSATANRPGEDKLKSSTLGGGKDTQQNSRRAYDRFLKAKDLIGIPWRVAFGLQADGWYLRQDIIWSKLNPMPESVTDRCTKAHEYIFLMSKSARYHYDADAIKEEGSLQKSGNTQLKYVNGQHLHRTKSGFLEMRQNVYERVNKRSVWEVATQPFGESHFATFPPDLIEPCIKAGTSERGCCANCGAPWERQVERGELHGRSANDGNGYVLPKGQHSDGRQKQRNDAGWTPNHKRNVVTLGWLPTCDCAAAVVPCTVLDPFGGAGTTGLVADRLQRNAILIELNPKYAEMAEARVRDDAGMFAEIVFT